MSALVWRVTLRRRRQLRAFVQAGVVVLDAHWVARGIQGIRSLERVCRCGNESRRLLDELGRFTAYRSLVSHRRRGAMPRRPLNIVLHVVGGEEHRHRHRQVSLPLVGPLH